MKMNKFLTIVDLVVAMDVEVDAVAVLLSLKTSLNQFNLFSLSLIVRLMKSSI